jgi:tryptophan synthase alpha chain
MSRIGDCLQTLREAGRTALVPFVTAGDPAPATTVATMHALADAGADIIELGVPFSDPMADGPVIQRSSERALQKGITTDQVLGFVAAFRETNRHTPVVLMGYANPIERMGSARFIERARHAGVDGVLVVDYLPEEAAEFTQALRTAGLDAIFLLAPTSTPKRIAQVAAMARGYIYYVALKGVTGATNLNQAEIGAQLALIREHTTVPIAVGFGIRDAQTACAVAEHADAVVIGSALVQALEHSPSDRTAMVAAQFVGDIRRALDSQPARRNRSEEDMS